MMLKGLTVQYLLRQTYPLQGRRDDPVPRGRGRRRPHRVPVGARARRHDDRHRRLRRKGGAREGDTAARTRSSTRARISSSASKEITGGKGVPVVYDGVGKDTFPASLDCLSPRGLFVSFGNASGPVAAVRPRAAGAEGLALRDAARRSSPTRRTRAIAERDGERAVRPRARRQDQGRVAADFPLKDAAAAHRALQSRQTTGSTLLLARRARQRAGSACAPRLLARRFVDSARAASISSDAVSAQRADAFARPAHRRRRRAGRRRCAALPRRRCPARAARRAMPASTSPEPAVASAGLPLALMSNVPSGRASMLPAPFSTTCARECVASRVAASHAIALNVAPVSQPSRRAASAGCGVASVGAARVRDRVAQRSIGGDRLSASASSTSGTARRQRRASRRRLRAFAAAEAGTDDQRVAVVADARSRRAASARGTASRRAVDCAPP